MKVIQIVSLFMLCASFVNLAHAEQKIGFVSTEAIIALLPMTKRANDELADMQTKFLTQGQGMQADMKAKYDELVAKNETGQLSDNLKQLGQQEMTQMQQDLNEHSQRSQETLTKRRNVLFKPILKQVNETIQQVSKDLGFDIVLDVQEAGLLYGKSDYNLTREVLIAMGVDVSDIPELN
ncbi:MAG: OmpH family outer membrane protein [Verrucomicrobia bacterium]|nr:OmpH family outer membrane protein [Verrucomicrobiota bacterium]